jgi:hypothetical protein
LRSSVPVGARALGQHRRENAVQTSPTKCWHWLTAKECDRHIRVEGPNGGALELDEVVLRARHIHGHDAPRTRDEQ